MFFPSGWKYCSEHGGYVGLCVPCESRAVTLFYCKPCGCNYVNKTGKCDLVAADGTHPPPVPARRAA